MIKITIRNRNYTIRTVSVGQSFGSVARVRIGSRMFESRTCPFGFTASAVSDVCNRVRSVYPEAYIS